MRALDVATKFENCCTGFWLLVWKKWCLKKGIAKEIENYVVKPRKRRFHFIDSFSDTD